MECQASTLAKNTQVSKQYAELDLSALNYMDIYLHMHRKISLREPQ
jgi:hypothetical protein